MDAGVYTIKNFEMTLGENANRNFVMRWGEFIENVEDCKFGVKLSVESDEPAFQFLQRLREYPVDDRSALYLNFVKVS
jgi:hypothetical protein